MLISIPAMGSAALVLHLYWWKRSDSWQLFHQAVLSLHGPEEAQCAAEDWLHELETTAMHNNPIHWRRISLAAADGLALRLTTASIRQRMSVGGN